MPDLPRQLPGRVITCTEKPDIRAVSFLLHYCNQQLQKLREQHIQPEEEYIEDEVDSDDTIDDGIDADPAEVDHNPPDDTPAQATSPEKQLQHAIAKLENQIRTLEHYYQQLVRYGCIRTQYTQRRKMGRSYGRSYCLQNVNRLVRQSLSRKKAYDVDMVNCHPSILLQFCDKEGIECPYLRNYVCYREDKLEAVCDADGCDRETAKQRYLSVIYGGYIKTFCPGLRFFEQEMMVIRNRICHRFPKYRVAGIESHERKLRKNPLARRNIAGSCISHLLCDLENDALMAMYDSCVEQGVTVSSLCFDGMLIEKGWIDEDNGKDLQTVLRTMEAAILHKTGYKISLVEKPMDKAIEIPEDYMMADYTPLHLRNAEKPSCFYSLVFPGKTVEEIEQSLTGCLVLIVSGGNAFWMSRNWDHIHRHVSWTMMKLFPYSCKTTSNSITVPNPDFVEGSRRKGEKSPTKEVEYSSILKALMKKMTFQAHCSFDQMQFRPFLDKNPTPSGVFNTFSGFKFPYRRLNDDEYQKMEEDLTLLLNHIKVVWAKRNDVYYDYIMGWFANIIKCLGKNKVAMVVRGGQGCGKTMITDFIGKVVIGYQYYLELQSIEQLTQQFNNHLENKVLTVLCEVHSFGGRGAEATHMKNVIDSDIIHVQQKFQDSRLSNCWNNYIITTNENGMVVKIEWDDRRYAAFECSDEKVGDREYFQILADFLKNPETAEMMFQYLANYRKEWKSLPIPDTEYRRDMKDQDTSSPIEFFQQLARGNIEDLERYAINIEPALPIDDPDRIYHLATSVLMAEYRKWCLEEDKYAVKSSKAFATAIKPIGLVSREQTFSIPKHKDGEPEVAYHKQQRMGYICQLSTLRQQLAKHLRLDENYVWKTVE